MDYAEQALRKEAFLRAVKEASDKYGFDIRAIVHQEQLGPVIQTRALIDIFPIDGWENGHRRTQAQAPIDKAQP